jgi:dipeptidase
MGANENGVVIGNEAVFATTPAAREKALIGMDLVRLGLERGATASEAVEVITGLLEAHGQGGDCGHLHEHFYDNSFLVTDHLEAFIIETVGRLWVVERVRDIRAISNAFSIGSGAIHQGSANLGDLSMLDFAAQHLDEARDSVSHGRQRCERATTLLRRRSGLIERADMMAVLRDHGADDAPHWHPAQTIGRTICMHAGEGERRGQSVGSLISELRPDGRAVHWVTAASAPCTAIFRPLLPGVAIPAHGRPPGDQAETQSRWWRHEALHRDAVTGDFAAWLATHAAERDAAEARFAARIEEALSPGGDVAGAVAECWREADAVEASWAKAAPKPDLPADFVTSWREHDDLATRPSRRTMRDG